MKTVLRRTGAVLLWILVVLLLAPVVVPPFLDRIYYRGPVSDHFDGERFFNPDGEPAGWSGGGFPVGRMLRFGLGVGRTPWPERVAVRQTKPWRAAFDPCAPHEEYWPATEEIINTTPMKVWWVGHATVLVQVGATNILTDPVWSKRTGPFGLGPRRVRVPGIRFEDLPKIDLVLISHNHYDHMDMETIRRLQSAHDPLMVMPLGNDTILRASVPDVRTIVGDWYDRIALSDAVTATLTPAHHWSARGIGDRRMALWSGFFIDTPAGAIWFAGDTGYGDGAIFRTIRQRCGAPDLALIPIGAYEPRWFMAAQHVNPAEAVRIMQDVGARRAVGIHWGTFQLTDEPREEPRARLAEALTIAGIEHDRFIAAEAGDVFDV